MQTKDIRLRDKAYIVDCNLFQIVVALDVKDFRPDENIKAFSTEEAARKWIQEQNPNKSLAMIREALVVQGFAINSANNLIEQIERGLEKTKYS